MAKISLKINGTKRDGQLVHEILEKRDKDLFWNCLVQSDLKVQTEATIWAVQEEALRTNYTKNKIDKISEISFIV